MISGTANYTGSDQWSAASGQRSEVSGTANYTGSGQWPVVSGQWGGSRLILGKLLELWGGHQQTKKRRGVGPRRFFTYLTTISRT